MESIRTVYRGVTLVLKRNYQKDRLVVEMNRSLWDDKEARDRLTQGLLSGYYRLSFSHEEQKLEQQDGITLRCYTVDHEEGSLSD